jgi:hypothetical protein
MVFSKRERGAHGPIRTWHTLAEHVVSAGRPRFLENRNRFHDTNTLDRYIHGCTPLAINRSRVGGREKLRFLRSLLETFDRTKYARAIHQKQCHAVLVKSMVHLIYGAEYEAEKRNILIENEWSLPIKHETAIGMPRRYGKTTLTAMIVAAVALVLAIPIAIFSPGKRQSVDMLIMVKTFIDLLIKEGGLVGYSFGANSKEMLEIIHPDGSISCIRSYPARIEICSACACGWWGMVVARTVGLVVVLR